MVTVLLEEDYVLGKAQLKAEQDARKKANRSLARMDWISILEVTKYHLCDKGNQDDNLSYEKAVDDSIWALERWADDSKSKQETGEGVRPDVAQSYLSNCFLWEIPSIGQ